MLLVYPFVVNVINDLIPSWCSLEGRRKSATSERYELASAMINEMLECPEQFHALQAIFSVASNGGGAGLGLHSLYRVVNREHV
eukprot:gene1375-biopygen10877